MNRAGGLFASQSCGPTVTLDARQLVIFISPLLIGPQASLERRAHATGPPATLICVAAAAQSSRVASSLHTI